jgi:hypothetical protein
MLKKRLVFIPLLLTAIILAGAACSQHNVLLTGGKRMIWTQLVHSSRSSFVRPAYMVVKDDETWMKTWRRIKGRYADPKAAPIVDFKRYMVLVAAMGPKNSGGYSIRITRVVDAPTRIEVDVEAMEPGITCATSSVMTSPVQAVRIRRSKKKVNFNVYPEVRICGIS